MYTCSEPSLFFSERSIKKNRVQSLCSLKRCIGFLLACEFEALFVLVSLRLAPDFIIYLRQNRCVFLPCTGKPVQYVCIYICLIVSKCGAALCANESGTHISVNHLFPACRENTVSQNKVNFQQCS
jgi:hypothetical protein